MTSEPQNMNDNSVPELKLAEFLPYKLSVLSNRISRAIADSYEQQFDLTLPEWRVMAVLGEKPGLSAGQVAQHTAMDKVAVSRAVSRLLDAGRINRSFDVDDRRRSILSLSQEGEAIYRRIVPLARRYENTLLEGLNTEEKRQLDAVLEKLARIEHELWR
jgi:DNA-binding MarR family transcriptional regulator